jgi:hypothetical protein
LTAASIRWKLSALERLRASGLRQLIEVGHTVVQLAVRERARFRCRTRAFHSSLEQLRGGLKKGHNMHPDTRAVAKHMLEFGLTILGRAVMTSHSPR